MKFKEGMSVVCRIEGELITDAKLTLKEKRWFICQNVLKGMSCVDKFGYKYSWYIGPRIDTNNLKLADVDFIVPADSTDIEDIYVGCKIKNNSYLVEVLSISGGSIGVSYSGDFNVHGFFYTLEMLKKQEYKLVPVKGPKPGLVYLTIKDISDGKGKGIPAHLIRIKEVE